MDEEERKRTIQQNKSIHKYCENLAIALNEAGFDQRSVLYGNIERQIMRIVKMLCPIFKNHFQNVFDRLSRKVDLPWSKHTAKDNLWRPVQIAMFDKHSTTDLTTKEVSEIYEVLNRHMSEKFGVYVEWPCVENQSLAAMEER